MREVDRDSLGEEKLEDALTAKCHANKWPAIVTTCLTKILLELYEHRGH